jgi:hypothetical protein
MYKNIILLVVLYGRETRFLSLMEEHRLRVFENRVLRRMCGPNGGGGRERARGGKLEKTA